VRIPRVVVEDGLLLDRLSRHFQVESYRPALGAGCLRADTDFQSGEGLPPVAVGHLGQKAQRRRVRLDRQ